MTGGPERMGTRCVAALGAALIMVSAPVYPASSNDVQVVTEDDKAFYAFGTTMAQQLSTLNCSPHEADMIAAGLKDGLLKRAQQVDVERYKQQFFQVMFSRSVAAAAPQRKAGEALLAAAAAEKGAQKTASGMVIQEISPGTGASPKRTDKVSIMYEGTLADGRVFDSKRDRATAMLVDGGIRCLAEGLQLMKVGGKSKLVCPPELAYGDVGQPPKIPPGSTLTYDVELLAIDQSAASAVPGAPAPTQTSATPPKPRSLSTQQQH